MKREDLARVVENLILRLIPVLIDGWVKRQKKQTDENFQVLTVPITKEVKLHITIST